MLKRSASVRSPSFGLSRVFGEEDQLDEQNRRALVAIALRFHRGAIGNRPTMQVRCLMREGCYGTCASQLACIIHDGSAHRAVALMIVRATGPHCAWRRRSGDSRRGTAFLVYLLGAVLSNRLLRDRSNARASDRWFEFPRADLWTERHRAEAAFRSDYRSPLCHVLLRGSRHLDPSSASSHRCRD